MINDDHTTTIAALQQRLAELETREERYRLAVESSHDGMWDWNLTTGEIYHSPRWLEFLGYHPSDIAAEVPVFQQLVHPDDIPPVQAAIQAHLTNQTPFYEAEFRIKTASGTWLWTLAHGKIVAHDEHGQPQRVIGTYTNITERKHAEHLAFEQKAALKQQVAAQQRELHRAQAALNQSGDAIFWTNTNSNLIYVNTAACTQLGYTEDELLGKTIAFVEPSFTTDELDNIMVILKQQSTVTFEATHQRKDGSLFPVEIQASQILLDDDIFICAYVRDITERKQHEEQLRLFQQIVERATDNIVYVDNEGNIVYCNPAHRTALGYGDEIIGMPGINTIAPEDHANFATYMQQLLATGSWRGEGICIRKDGSTFPVEAVMSTVYDSQGVFRGTFGFNRDITERKKHEAELQHLQQEIIEAQRTAIRELSSPLLPIDKHILALPLVGTIDSTRATHVMETLLEGIATHQSNTVIVDITGIHIVDTQVAQAILQTAQAARLLGTQVILTGIQPQIAQTLVQLGADMSGIVTRGTIQAGIAYALKQTG